MANEESYRILEKLSEIRDWYANIQFSRENSALLEQKSEELRRVLGSIVSNSTALNLTIKMAEADLERHKDKYHLMITEGWVSHGNPEITPKFLFDSCRQDIVLSLAILINTPF